MLYIGCHLSSSKGFAAMGRQALERGLVDKLGGLDAVVRAAAARAALVPGIVPIVTVEAGVTRGWRGLGGSTVTAIGIDRFGECGPANQVFEYLGITAANVVAKVEGVIAG